MSTVNSIDRAVRGASGAPLSKRQKAEVCELARAAWERAGRPFFDPTAWAIGEPLALSATDAFELWRHERQEAACGTKHLTCSTQRDYPLLMAEFSRLNGDEDAAARWLERAAMDPRRQAMAKLEREIERARSSGGLDRPWDYVQAIARRQFGAAVEDCSAKQVWSLVFTLRNRMNAKRHDRRAAA